MGIMFLCIFSCNFIQINDYIQFFIVGYLIISALHTVPRLIPYGSDNFTKHWQSFITISTKYNLVDLLCEHNAQIAPENFPDTFCSPQIHCSIDETFFSSLQLLVDIICLYTCNIAQLFSPLFDLTQSYQYLYRAILLMSRIDRPVHTGLFILTFNLFTAIASSFSDNCFLISQLWSGTKLFLFYKLSHV